MEQELVQGTELCLMGRKYVADKSPLVYHSYTPFYHALWNDKRGTVKRLFELGVNAGASHRMWQEYFPNAEIIGADFQERLLFDEGRIKMYYCDQSKKESLEELTKLIGKDFDIIIDDGSHETEHQILTAKVLLPLLAKDGLYVIEDVSDSNKILEALSSYHCEYFPFDPEKQVDNLILIYA